ncbi:O-methyltransferase [Porphyromonas gingivalis SJD2]|nr:O-methyltransferase [Porphyromonas gingivalis SJD2]OWR78435.1 O-methyltransferase [Porphyromonas gingivalis SJD5]OWR82002.1 O-methyltransferase [Porphyromonas gingivalis SJD12]PDP67044.1 O-methyltransferase [Porphyromonas gingivalis]RRG13769.1 O-methyltransferase [Porphyromonas gingivalis]
MLRSMTIDEYIATHTSAEPPLLQKLDRDAHLHLMRPRMLSGHLQGRFLSMISHLMRPRRILEIGTYTGYASLCLAEGLTPDGLLHTLERDDEMEDFIRRYLEASDLGGKIRLHIGEALDLIPDLVKNERFDLIYMDADKRQYTLYYEMIIDHLPPGALILADNTLWDGKVVAEPLPTDSQTQGILRFNEMVLQDERVENLIVPMRDGLSMIRVR